MVDLYLRELVPEARERVRIRRLESLSVSCAERKSYEGLNMSGTSLPLTTKIQAP